MGKTGWTLERVILCLLAVDAAGMAVYALAHRQPLLAAAPPVLALLFVASAMRRGDSS